MGISHRAGSASIPADIVARDRDGRIVLLVEIKAPRTLDRPAQPDSHLLEWANQWARRHQNEPRPYLMLASANDILIFDSTKIPDPSHEPRGIGLVVFPDKTLETGPILAAYDPSFVEKAKAGTIYEFYLRTLIEVWLEDLARHWKHHHPPGEETFKEIELLPRLEGGSVDSEDPDDDPLR